MRGIAFAIFISLLTSLAVVGPGCTSNDTTTASDGGGGVTLDSSVGDDGGGDDGGVTGAPKTFTIGGKVTGLSGSGLVLKNGTEMLAVPANGAFVFKTPVSTYAVTVATQPSSPTQACVIANGVGRVSSANITNVMVTCATSRFKVGGTVIGLAGTGAVLENNSTDDLAVSANGQFVFATAVDSGNAFKVTIKTQPSSPTQTCVVSGASGTVGGADVTSVVLNCARNIFTVGGQVSGLTGTVVLQDNTGHTLSVGSNGDFAFVPVVSGTPYLVSVLTQPGLPVVQTCTVTSGVGVVSAANITSVRVACLTNGYTIGGGASGLAGAGLVLQDNGGNSLPVAASGAFTFTTPVASGAAYAVTILSQPTMPSQTCTLTGDTGTVGAASVTNVAIACTTNRYTIGGTTAGLVGTGLVLQNSGGDDLEVSQSGSLGFAFATSVASGRTYAISILTQPSSPTQTCTVSGGTGTVVAGNVSSVTVNCSTNTYVVGGTISGLAGTAVLENNAGDDLSVTANGTFAFALPIASSAAYAVTVLTQPGKPSQTCTVTIGTGTGTIVAANVASVVVTCATNHFTVGGNVTGLAGTGLVLRNNDGDGLPIGENGSFKFPASVLSGAVYAVTVSGQPAGLTQTCAVTNEAGTVGGTNVTDVTVICTTTTFQVGGTVVGLLGSGLVLQDNGGDDFAVTANGTFHFTTNVASGGVYAISAPQQPTNLSQTCVVTGGSGTVTSADVLDATVTCTTSLFAVGGTVTGLAGSGLVLQDNAGDNLGVTTDGPFAFATSVASGATFTVSVLTQPSAATQTCKVSAGDGTVGGGNITTIVVNCSTTSFTIAGTVNGLQGTVVLQDNGTDNQIVTTNGDFAFALPIASGSTYAVSVLTQPTSPNQTCTVTSGSNTVGAVNVIDVTVTCVTTAYSIGGTIIGLAPGDKVVLRNNAADDTTFSLKGDFAFPTSIPDGTMYSVDVLTQPDVPSQSCVVTNPGGMVSGANVASVIVTCTTNRYAISGTVTGLTGGSVVLQDNGADNKTVSTNTTFTFDTAVPSGGAYSVVVLTQPSSPTQTCVVTNASGTVGGTDVINVAVACTTASPNSTDICGFKNPGGIFCGGNCSNNHAQYANWYCNLLGFASAASYDVLTSGQVQCVYWNGGSSGNVPPLTMCSQVIPSQYGLASFCDAIKNLVCQDPL